MEPLFLDRRLIGSSSGSASPRVDFPWFIELYQQGRLKLDGVVLALPAARRDQRGLRGHALGRGRAEYHPAVRTAREVRARAASPPARERRRSRRLAATTSGIPPTRAASRRCASPAAPWPRGPARGRSGRSRGTTPRLSGSSRWSGFRDWAFGACCDAAWCWAWPPPVGQSRLALTVVSVIAPEGAPAGVAAPAEAGAAPGVVSPDQTTGRRPGRRNDRAAGRRGRRGRGAVPAGRARRLVEGARSAGVDLRGGTAVPRPRQLALGQAGRPRFRAAAGAQAASRCSTGSTRSRRSRRRTSFAADHAVLQAYYAAAIDRSRIGPRTGEGRDRHAFLLAGVDLQRLERISAARLSEAACQVFVGPLPFCWQPATIPGGAYGASVNAAIRELAAPRLPGDGPPPLPHTDPRGGPRPGRGPARGPLRRSAPRPHDPARATAAARVPCRARGPAGDADAARRPDGNRAEPARCAHRGHGVGRAGGHLPGRADVLPGRSRTIAPLQLLAPERPCRR